MAQSTFIQKRLDDKIHQGADTSRQLPAGRIDELHRGSGRVLPGQNLHQSACAQRLPPTGVVVTVVGAASHNLAPLYLKGANLHMVLVLVPIMFGTTRPQQGEMLERIARLVEHGKLAPRLDPQRFGLEETADAHRKLEAGEAKGKLIIEL